MLVLVFSLTACGETEDEDSDKDRKSRTEKSDDAEDDGDTDVEDDGDSKEEDSGETAVWKEAENDTEYVVEQMVNEALGKTMTYADSTMEMEMSISMEGLSLDIDMMAMGKNLVQTDPYMAYSSMDITINMLGQEETVSSESFVVLENGSLVTYTYDGESDYWSVLDTGMTEADILEQQEASYEWLAGKSVSDFVVDSELYDINGKDAYRIEVELTGEEMNRTLNGMSGITEMFDEMGLEDLDMSCLTVPSVYYVDAESYEIVQMEISIEGMDEMLNDMMYSLLVGTDPDYDMEFVIGKFSMVYSNISYEPVEMPELPDVAQGVTWEEVEDASEETAQDQQEGEVYIIEEADCYVGITCPADWTVTYTAYDTLDIENEELWQTAEFVMYCEVTRDDFVAYVEDVVVAYVEEYGLIADCSDFGTIGDYEVMAVYCEYFDFYFAWAQVDEAWLLITVTDYLGLGEEEALYPVMEMVDLEAGTNIL